MECFVITVNGWKKLTIITKHSILDIAAALDPPMGLGFGNPEWSWLTQLIPEIDEQIKATNHLKDNRCNNQDEIGHNKIKFE